MNVSRVILVIISLTAAVPGGVWSKCRIIPLSGRKNLSADLIVSGTITSFYLKPGEGPFIGKIRVRRVFRGDKKYEGRSILVNGFGSKKICVSTPRLGTTKLFLLDSVKEENYSFKLQSSILRLNLRNLKVLWAIDKKEKHSGTNSHSCVPVCNFGAICSQGKCSCNMSCSEKLHPVCGGNQKTYKNICHLKLAECESKKSIRRLYDGACQSAKSPPGPCVDPQPGTDCGPVCGGEACREPREVGFLADANANITTNNIGRNLGESCLTDNDCKSKSSACYNRVCKCKPGFVNDAPGYCRPDVSPCSFLPCEAGGTCDEHDGTFSCTCREGRTGKFCEKKASDESLNKIGFTGKSVIKLKYLPTSTTRTSVHMTFKTFSKEGLILLGQQRERGYGDFFSLAVVGGYVELQYDLGSGPTKLRSSSPVRLGEWHNLVVERYRQDAKITLDDEESFSERNHGRNKYLNIGGPAYIGGFDIVHRGKIASIVGTKKNFQGCITNIRLNNRKIDLTQSEDFIIKERKNVIECSVHPCNGIRCANGRTCQIRNSRGKCRCPSGYGGRNCRKATRKGKRRNQKRVKTKEVRFPFLNKNTQWKYKYDI